MPNGPSDRRGMLFEITPDYFGAIDKRFSVSLVQLLPMAGQLTPVKPESGQSYLWFCGKRSCRDDEARVRAQ